MEKHWTHHAYTNHKDKDPDCIAAEPIIIFNNYPEAHPSRRWHHKVQAILCLPAFSLYWLATMLNLDFLELIDSNAATTGMHFHNDFIARRRKLKVAILSRLIHAYIHIGAPFLHHGFHWSTAGHVMTFGASGSLSLGLLFVLSHNFVGADRDPTQEARRTGGHVCWYRSQGDLVDIWRIPRGSPHRWTQLSGRTSLVSSHELGLVPLHCSHGQKNMQEAWCQVHLLPLGVAKHVIHVALRASHRHQRIVRQERQRAVVYDGNYTYDRSAGHRTTMRLQAWLKQCFKSFPCSPPTRR